MGRYTSLDHIDTNVIYARINLLLDKIGRRLMNVIYSLGILGSQSRSGCHGIAAMSGNDLLVSLKAAIYSNQSLGTSIKHGYNLRSSRAVRTCNDQYAFRPRHGLG